MNQHGAAALTTAIKTALKRPGGLRTSQIDGYTVNQVGRMLNKMMNRVIQEAFVARICHKTAIYFDSEERAKACVEAHQSMRKLRHSSKPKSSQELSDRQYALRTQNKKDAAVTENQEFRRRIDERKAQAKANRTDYELTEIDRLKITHCEGFNESKGKYYVKPESVPMFRYGSGS